MSYVERDILLGVVGSHAYGMSTPESDVDKLGIVQHNTRSLLRFSPPTESQVLHNPDVTYHELGKFLRLALKVNPTITELLWLDEYEILTFTGAELINMRTLFLSSKYVRDAYLGYATQQFKRLSDKQRFPDVPISRIKKHARHLYRLIEQGTHLYTRGELPIRVKDRERVFEFGEDVANDPLIARDVLHRAERVFDERTTALRSEPEAFTIEQWMLDKRRDFWE